jgi:hypothetical protein
MGNLRLDKRYIGSVGDFRSLGHLRRLGDFRSLGHYFRTGRKLALTTAHVYFTLLTSDNSLPLT